LVIWVLFMVPLLLVLFLLLRPGSGQQPAATGDQTPVDRNPNPTATQAGDQTPAPAQNPLVVSPTPPAGTAAPATSPAGAGGQTPAPDKFLVIVTDKGRIVARLYTDPGAGVANTIANFEQKANSGYFDGLTFHRVEDWVIQGGDPTGTGMGGGRMPAEYNQLPFKAGALGVARGPDPTQNSDSQFFIVKTDAQWLDGQYTNWGQVVEGMDVVNQIAVGDKMLKVTVETR
jgi:peptidyl-prolyl cis-trans isomerase B (cyclophilin B)